MMYSTFLVLAVFFLLAGSNAQKTKRNQIYSAPPTMPLKFDTLNNGKGLYTGKVTEYYKWQASGVLTEGGCKRIQSFLDYESCYAMYLGSQGHEAISTPTHSGSGEQDDLDGWVQLESTPELNEKPLIGLFEVDEGERFFEEAASRPNGRNPKRYSKRYTVDRFELGRVPEEDAEDEFDDWVEQTELVKRGLAPTLQQAAVALGHGNSTLNKRGSGTARQRNEIFTWPPAPSGQQWRYTWRTWLDRKPTTGNHFFHVWQILTRSGERTGPVISLGFINGRAAIADIPRKCTSCVSTILERFTSGVITHNIDITWGLDGKFHYWAKNEQGKTILNYHASGDVGEFGSLKIGLYRRIVDSMSPVQAVVIEFSSRRVQ